MKYIKSNFDVIIVKAKADSAVLLIGEPQNSPKFIKYKQAGTKDPGVLKAVAHVLLLLKRTGRTSVSGEEFNRFLSRN